MNPFVLICFLFVFACSTSVAVAENSTQQALSETRIEIDEERSVIRFVIDGVEQARLTQDGLEVRNGIHFGGAIVDVGDTYDEPNEKEPDDVE